MKFENVSIKNLESAEKYVEKLMQSEKIFQKEYVEEHIFIGLQRSGQEEIENCASHSRYFSDELDAQFF